MFDLISKNWTKFNQTLFKAFMKMVFEIVKLKAKFFFKGDNCERVSIWCVYSKMLFSRATALGIPNFYNKACLYSEESIL